MLLRVVVGFAAGLSLAGVGCAESKLQRGTPEIEVTPGALQFGTLNLGESAELGLVIKSTGTAALTIAQIVPSGDAVFALADLEGEPFDPGHLPLGLAQAQSKQKHEVRLGVRFTPTARKAYRGALTIGSNAAHQSKVVVTLSGTCTVPDIEVDPPALDFGGVRFKSSSSRRLTLRNTGEAPLRVRREDLRLEGQDRHFTWVAGDMTIAGGGSDAIEVIYSPGSPRFGADGRLLPDEDTLLIASNDPDESPVRVPLLGQIDLNLPPVTDVHVIEVRTPDGDPVSDLCKPAPSDTLRIEGQAFDPEGRPVLASNLFWAIEARPLGSFRTPLASPDAFHPTFKPDLTGDYVLCLAATDPEGNLSTYDPAAACTCAEANAAAGPSCPCVHFQALPRDNIRIELIWDILGPDLDLHLLKPGGVFCTKTTDCSWNPLEPDDPTWNRSACVETGTLAICSPPNCDAAAKGCAPGQECYNGGCAYHKCSGSDCYWDGRNPNWGDLAGGEDDPMLAIDCTSGCRIENIYYNRPEPGIYTLLVNTFRYRGDTTATVRVYFKGDQTPSAEFQSRMTEECDTWTVALLDWVDDERHQVTALPDAHTKRCCN